MHNPLDMWHLLASVFSHHPDQEAECKKEMMDVKFLADTKMADSKRELELQKASFNQEVNTKVGLNFISIQGHHHKSQSTLSYTFTFMSLR